tara:strand:+ start:379 stop:891 length:513 start_codon:yes stop_codon:yes gene_type:complete
VKKKDKFIIPFDSLKDGLHEYEFHADTAFFSNFDYSLIEDADIKAHVSFEKKPSMFRLQLNLDGVINTVCDRCLDDLQIAIEGEQEFVVKITEKTIDEDDHIISLSPNEQELDLTHVIYESIHLLMPIKIDHENISDCNPEVIAQLNEINSSVEDEEEQDPRWDALKNIK